MHVPDGFLDVTTSVATGAVAAGAIGVSLQRSKREISEAGAPLTGLVAAFVFAVQMVNFPVGVGTSGHLMGGALAAVLVGPWSAVLCLSVVLIVQALLFADGGLTALGTNITLIGVVTVVVGYGVAKALLAVLPRRPGSVVPASFVGALVSVPAAALVFVALYLVGGAVELPLGGLLGTMLGFHLLIGVGEAIITALTVGAVVAARPDLVYVARHLRPDLVLTDADGACTTVAADEPLRPEPSRRTLGIGLAVTLLVAGLVSAFASANPDGLESAAQRVGFLDTARESAVAGSPLADYGVIGIGNAVLSTGLAGFIGVAATIGAGVLLARLAGGRSRDRRNGADDHRRSERV